MTEQQFIDKYSKVMRTGDTFMNHDDRITLVNRFGCVLAKFIRRTSEVIEY